MKVYTPSVVRFAPQSLVSAASARLGLAEIQRPVAPAVLLRGEDVLLPSRAGDSRQRYGCVLYVVSACGRKALPVLSRGAWSQALLPQVAEGHALWADLSSGIEFAIQHLAESALTLDGAVEAARQWLKSLGAALNGGTAQGCVVLLGHGRSSAHSAALPQPPAARVSRPQTITPVQHLLSGLRFAA